MKLMSFWSKFFIALAITILATTGAVVGVFAGQKEQIDMGGSIKYTVPYFTVKFLNYDNTVFETQQVAYGHDATKPATDPIRPGYTFKSWTDYTNITQDRSVTANWIKNEAYLTTGSKWQAIVNASAVGSNANIEQIEFVSSVPSGATLIGSVGVTNETATTVWTEGCGVFDVKAYYTALSTGKYKISFSSPYTIYAPKDSSYLFSHSSSANQLTNLTSISFGNFDTSNVTDMKYMFSNCQALTSLDVSNFDTREVTSMIGMFANCSKITSLNLQNFLTYNVTTMRAMFESCSSLITVNLAKFDTFSVTDMEMMFYKCSSLISLDISMFDMSNATCGAMISDCSSLTEIKTPSALRNGWSIFLPTKTGYSWVDQANTNNAYTQITSACTNKTLVLRINTYTLSIDPNGGYRVSDNSTAVITVTKEYNSGESISERRKSGYTLTGYTLKNTATGSTTDIGGATFSFNSSTKTGVFTQGTVACTLVAKWTANTYAETFLNSYISIGTGAYNNGGTWTVSNGEYSFKTVSTTSNGGPYLTNLYSLMSNGEKYRIYFTAKATTAISLTASFEAGGSKAISLTTGYQEFFVDVTYNASSTYKALTFYSTGWTGQTLSIKNIKVAKIATFNSTYGTLPTPTRTNYTFNGWSKNFFNPTLTYGYTSTCTRNGEIFTFNTGSQNSSSLFFEIQAWNNTSHVQGIFSATSTGVHSFVFTKNSSITQLRFKYNGNKIDSCFYYDVSSLPDGSYVIQVNITTMQMNKIVVKDIMIEQNANNSKTAYVSSTNYVLASSTVNEPFNRTLFVSWTLNESYLRKDWFEYLINAFPAINDAPEGESYAADKILSISFVNTIPEGSGYATFSVGATTIEGSTAYTTGTKNVSDVTAYIKANADFASKFNVTVYDIIFYSPVTIYAPTDSSNLFAGHAAYMHPDYAYTAALSGHSLSSINFDNFDTSRIVNASYMFVDLNLIDANATTSLGDVVLKELNLTKFDTSNVTNMSLMFYHCNLKGINLSSFNTSKVTDMSCMFCSCDSLTSLDVSNFDTSKVTNMSYMFRDCSSLTSLNLSNFNTSNVTNMSGMFANCASLTELNLSSFDMSKVTDTSNMFSYCSGLTEIQTPKAIGNAAVDLPTKNGYSWLNQANTNNAYTQITSACINKTLVLRENNSYLRKDWATALKNNNVNFKQANIKTIQFVNTVPSGSGYTTVSVGATTSAGTTAYASGTAGVSDIIAYVKANSSDSTKYDVIFYSPVTIYAPDNSTYLFSDPTYSDTLKNLTSISFGNFNTSKVTYMTRMFYNCSSLTSLNLSNFNTSKVTGMWEMFRNCSSLTSLNLSSFNTSNVTDIGSMFLGCSSLTSLNLSSFNTSNVTDMSHMFNGCSKLTSLNLSNFNTSNVTDMGSMFYGCSKLTSLNVSSFNTSSVTKMLQMFWKCSSLTSLNLSNFNTSKVTNMYHMFEDCSSLTSLNLSSFDMSKIYSDDPPMLKGCSALKTIYTPKTMSTTVYLPGTSDGLHAWYKSTDSNRDTPYTTISSSNTSSTITLRPIMRTITITWGSDSNGNGDWNFNAQWNGSVQVSSSQGGAQSGTRRFRVEATTYIQCSFWIQSPPGLIYHKTGSVSISGTCTNSNFGSNTAPTAKGTASRTANASNFKSDITISFYFSAKK